MSRIFKGTEATRDFYDRIGWKREDGVLVDSAMFSPPSVGPIQQAMIDQRERVIRDLLNGPGLKLVELGCGGTPAAFLAPLCREQTAVDFSSAGLSEAARALEGTGVPFRTVMADITALPFSDDEFDAAYSAHTIYHINSVEGQAAALSEAMRVVHPGGCAVFVLANPFPLLFPVRFIRQVLRKTPLLGSLLNRFRKKPPLPYLPMPLGWLRSELNKWGEVELRAHALPSVWFSCAVSERGILGKGIWSLLRSIEAKHRRAAARLGCFVSFRVIKTRHHRA